MTEPDDDAAWRSIVENYGERAVLDAVETEESDPAAPPAAESSEPSATERYQPEAGLIPDESPAAERDVFDAWDDPEDHFVPDEPEPLGFPEPPRLIAWAGVLGVPVLTIVFTVAHAQVPTWASLLALVWFVGGIGYLIATMRQDDEDDWDDGAVV